jgi:dolichol kinase
MIELAVAAAAIAAVPVAGELGVRRIRLSGENARKLVHAGSGIVAAALPLLLPYGQIVAIALGCAVLMAFVHRFRLLAALNGIERVSYGEVWFPIGVAALAAFFPHPAAYVYGTLVLGLADASAAVVGVRLGRRRLPFVRGKTVWGSTAFFATAVVVGVAVGGRLSVGIVVAAAALTAAEAVTSRGVDNLVVPVLAGLLAMQVWA